METQTASNYTYYYTTGGTTVTKSIPYKCPVCDGSGKYKRKTCHACGGTGLVWGTETSTQPGSAPYQPHEPYWREPYITWQWQDDNSTIEYALE